MNQQVILTLTDFLPFSCTDHHQRLVTKFRNVKIPFSYQFERTNDENISTNDPIYSLLISYRYDLLLGISETKINVFDRRTRELRKSIDFGNEIFGVLDDKHDEIYILEANKSYYVKKFRLGSIIHKDGLTRDQPPIWISESGINIPYGSAIFNGKSERFVVVLNHGISSCIYLLDCKSGKFVEDTIFEVPKDSSCLEIRGNLLFVGGKSVSIYEIDEKLFGKGKNVLKLLNRIEIGKKLYNIIVDDKSQRIMFNTGFGDGIYVLDSKTLEQVQHYFECNSFGISLDEFSGELFACYSDEIVIFK